MKSQVTKMRLIAMFYLSVFASALLLSGLLNNQGNLLSAPRGKSSAMVFSSSQDSVPLKGINVSAEPGSGSEDVTESDDKQDFVPLDFNFGFNSLLQWFFRLPLKSLSQVNAQPDYSVEQPIWLTIHNLRI